MLYEHRKHDGSLPIIGVNTFLAPQRGRRAADRSSWPAPPRTRSSPSSTASPTSTPGTPTEAPAALARLQQVAMGGGNVFDALMDAVRVCSLGQISEAFFEVGGRTGATSDGAAPQRCGSHAMRRARTLQDCCTCGRHREHAPLPFDPIAEATRHWREHGWERRRRRHGGRHLAHAGPGDRAGAGRRGAAPAELTFARYELLMLLSFTRDGCLRWRRQARGCRCTRPASPTPPAVWRTPGWSNADRTRRTAAGARRDHRRRPGTGVEGHRPAQRAGLQPHPS